MILLVPYKPEVPHYLSPKLWQGLVLVIALGICFLEAKDTLDADRDYVEEVTSMVTTDEQGLPAILPEGHAYLRLRPLLKIAPSKGDWDFKRLFFANFLHGSTGHLLFNLVGLFAGARICSTFLPFPALLAIFILGGSLGLQLSMRFSSEISDFIPHVGASAGIFALMGTYYVFNFRFRTRYFFWFPSRMGVISLRTSWFFFVDVILLELVLSTAQLFPNRLGNVDHIAHVVGFGAGALLALGIRWLLRWPGFLQTRGEYLFWRHALHPRIRAIAGAPYATCLQLLEVNPYNDAVKIQGCRALTRIAKDAPYEESARLFRFLSPTFLRLHTEDCARLIKALVARGKTIPEWWYKATPYDSVIRIAKKLTQPVEEQYVLLEFISHYRRAHPEGGSVDRKLELLMSKLAGVIPGPERTAVTATDGGTRTELSSKPQTQETPDSSEGTATKAS